MRHHYQEPQSFDPQMAPSVAPMALKNRCAGKDLDGNGAIALSCPHKSRPPPSRQPADSPEPASAGAHTRRRRGACRSATP
jgi:hypothetical protein